MSDSKEYWGWAVGVVSSMITWLKFISDKKQTTVNTFKTQQEISDKTIDRLQEQIAELKKDKTEFLGLHKSDLENISRLQIIEEDFHKLKIEFELYKLKKGA